jgi:hypothetical protein
MISYRFQIIIERRHFSIRIKIILFNQYKGEAMENTNELNNTMDDSIPKYEVLVSVNHFVNITTFEAKTILGIIHYLKDLINYLQNEFLHMEMEYCENDRSFVLHDLIISQHRYKRYLSLIYSLQKNLKRMYLLNLSVRDRYLEHKEMNK